MKNPTVDQLRAAVLAAGYRWFDHGALNLNLIGIRGDTREDLFDDLLAVVYRASDDGPLLLRTTSMTTDPGHWYRQNPLVPAGAAWLPPGQYRGLWQIGLHRGRYPALVQSSSVRVHRGGPDGAPDTGMHGINLHRASAHRLAATVGLWSAGCQVVQDPLAFEWVMELCARAALRWGPTFTYTLLTERQVFPTNGR